MFANLLFWAFVGMRVSILAFWPQHTMYTQTLNEGLENMAPVVTSVDWEAFPSVEILKDGVNVRDRYEAFIQRNWVDESGQMQAERIQMVPCSSIEHEQFAEGGMYYDEFTLNEDAYCPERGDIGYGGNMGTNLWVIPAQNSEIYNIYEDSTPYLST